MIRVQPSSLGGQPRIQCNKPVEIVAFSTSKPRRRTDQRKNSLIAMAPYWLRSWPVPCPCNDNLLKRRIESASERSSEVPSDSPCPQPDVRTTNIVCRKRNPVHAKNRNLTVAILFTTTLSSMMTQTPNHFSNAYILEPANWHRVVTFRRRVSWSVVFVPSKRCTQKLPLVCQMIIDKTSVLQRRKKHSKVTVLSWIIPSHFIASSVAMRLRRKLYLPLIGRLKSGAAGIGLLLFVIPVPDRHILLTFLFFVVV